MTISLGTIFKLAVYLVIGYFLNIAITDFSKGFDSAVTKVSAREAAIATAANQ